MGMAGRASDTLGKDATVYKTHHHLSKDLIVARVLYLLVCEMLNKSTVNL